MTLVTQVTLKRPVSGGNSLLTTWLPADPRIKVGLVITIKPYTRTYWRVDKVFSTLERDMTKNHGWDNNNYDIHESKAMKDRK